MFGFEFNFDRPWYLLLLLLLPVLWYFSFRSLANLGTWRRLVAIGLRTLVIVLFVFALAEAQLLRISKKIAVIYLLDQSESIPLAKREAMLDYVAFETAKHRDANRGDYAGVIVFGRDANIEIPPFDADVTIRSIESLPGFRGDATNLAAAMKLAQATFPEDSARRIVVVSDGNENLGEGRVIASMLADAGVGIDVVPVQLSATAEVAVEKVTLPSDIRRGQMFETRVVVNCFSKPTPDNPQGLVKGKLKLSRLIGRQEQLLDESEVVLEPGKNVFRFPHDIDEPAVYTYKADFVADNPAHDLMVQNNEATAFTHVRGRGRILLIEDWEHKGDFDTLVNRLRAQNLEVTVMSSDQLFTSLAELQGYDSVILGNVPRSSGENANEVTNFSDEQISMLVRNTEQMGCGLVMIGGPASFGAGGWTNTELEKAMPVDFQIKNAKVQAVGALVLMMHASEMAQGNHWQKVVARKAIQALGPLDYCGLIHWDFGGDSWLWAKNQGGLVRVGAQQRNMLAALSRMTPGDMPQFDPAMRMALAGFGRVNASVKHMIIISDGDPSKPAAGTIQGYINNKIQVTTVAVGAHGTVGHQTLQQIARATGGKYYVVNNPRALPKIYQREARRVTRPLIHEPAGGVSCQVVYDHEILKNIDPRSLPPLRGFVLTTLKQNPLVEQAIISPDPTPKGENSTLLASWTYGLGRTVVFTSDAGARWADGWTSWENYDKFFKQMIEWSMRPPAEDGKFTVATDIKDGKVRVVITALDKDDEFLNFIQMAGAAVGPDLDPFDIKISQVASGRYVGEFDAEKAGSYFVTVTPGPGKAPLIAGVSVPYSDEFRQQDTNVEFLTTLVNLTPEGGEKGKLIQGSLAQEEIDRLLEVDTFRTNLAPAFSSQDVWPWLLVIAATVFFADIFVRRVTIGFEWLAPIWAWCGEKVFRRQRVAAPDQRLERLRSRKAAISSQIDTRRAATRFEPQADPEVESQRELDDVLDAVSSAGPPRSAPALPTTSIQPGAAEDDDTYTSRLLKAKQKAWKDKHQPKDQESS